VPPNKFPEGKDGMEMMATVSKEFLRAKVDEKIRNTDMKHLNKHLSDMKSQLDSVTRYLSNCGVNDLENIDHLAEVVFTLDVDMNRDERLQYIKAIINLLYYTNYLSSSIALKEVEDKYAK
jgi:hypothetical protein